MSRTLNSAIYKRLVRQLKTERVAKGETQMSLASKLNRPQSFIAKIESLERRLDVLEFVQFCQALDVDPGALIQRALKRSSSPK